MDLLMVVKRPKIRKGKERKERIQKTPEVTNQSQCTEHQHWYIYLVQIKSFHHVLKPQTTQVSVDLVEQFLWTVKTDLPASPRMC